MTLVDPYSKLLLNIGNLAHRSVSPHNFSSSFSKKKHSRGSSCIADGDDNLQGDSVVEAFLFYFIKLRVLINY